MPQCPKCLEKNLSPPLEAWEQDPDGLCLLHSLHPEKDRDGNFTLLFNSKIAQEDYNFAWVYFPKDISFRELTFVKDVDFSWATFSGATDFYSASFGGRVNFIDSKFCNEVNFIGTKFMGPVTFLTIFENLADFRHSYFYSTSSFNGSEFKNAASFAMARFNGRANFSCTKFYGYVDFNSARFSFGCNFDQLFSKEVSFMSSEFAGNISFNEVNFSKATFRNAILTRTTKIYFQDINYKYRKALDKQKYHPIKIDFTYMQIQDGAFLSFQNISLTLAKFLGSDLSKIKFNNVEWFSMHGRNAVYDESIMRKEKKGSYAEIELIYQQLKSNYEDKKDFKRVGDFHYGEMDMHRMASPWKRRFPFSWYNLYWALNGYGERPLRAFILFLGIFVGLSFLSNVFGLTIANYNNPASFWQSTLFIFDKATLQRPQWATPNSGYSHLISSLSVLVLPGQLALFFLALRNRLGRRR